MAEEKVGDINGPPVRAFLVRVPDDSIGIEPRRVEVRVVRTEELGAWEDVIAEIDLEVGWPRTECQLMDLASDGPIELTGRCDPEEDQVRLQLMVVTFLKIKDLIREWQRQMYPDIDQRVEEKQERQAATSYLPDEEMVVQVCEVNDPTAPLIGASPDVVAFLVPKAHQVRDGLNFQTIAGLSALGKEGAMLEELSSLVRERQCAFTFKPSAMASDDLVGLWRKRFERAGLLKSV